MNPFLLIALWLLGWASFLTMRDNKLVGLPLPSPRPWQRSEAFGAKDRLRRYLVTRGT